MAEAPDQQLSPTPATDGAAATPRRDLLAQLQGMVRRYQRDIDHFDQALAEQLGLNRTDLRCVDLLFDEPISVGELAFQAGVTPAAATTIVDRLAGAGYVRRRPHPSDRRRIQVEVTPKIRRRVSDLLGPFVQDAVQEIDGYTDDELRVICRWLDESHSRRAAHVQRLKEWRRGRSKRQR